MASLRLYAYGALVAIVVALALYYRSHLISIGRLECEAGVAKAIAQQQALADENAQIYQSQSDKIRVEYRTRIKEVVKNVPVNHNCDLPDDTVRLLNDAISGTTRPAGKPLSTVPSAPSTR